MNKPPEFTDKCCLSFVLCLVIQLCPTLCDSIDCSLPGSSVHGDSPGKNTGVGCYILLQGIFPTQGIEPRSAVLQTDSLLSDHQGSPPCPFFFFLSFKPSKKYLRVYLPQAWFLNSHSETWERRDKGREKRQRRKEEKNIGEGAAEEDKFSQGSRVKG